MTPLQSTLYLEPSTIQDESTAYGEDIRQCNKCGLSRSIDDFHRNKSRDDGRSIWCKLCASRYARQWEVEKRDKLAKDIADGNIDFPEHKVCTKCDKTKPLDEFKERATGKFGRRAECRECLKKIRDSYWEENKEAILKRAKNKYIPIERKKKNVERQKESQRRWGEKNPDYYRIYGRKFSFKGYGVDQEWYEETLSAQGGGCDICGSKEPGGNGRFKIDHDHSCCNKSCTACDKCRRGLLCNKCNLKLGYLEKKEWLRKATTYINKYSKAKKCDVDQGTLFD